MNREFVQKNLLVNYRKSFEAVWNRLDNTSYNKVIYSALKYLDQNHEVLEDIIKSYLSTFDPFQRFVGAYLALSFGVEKEMAYKVFKSLHGAKGELNERLSFYVSSISNNILENGYFLAYPNQKKVNYYMQEERDLFYTLAK